MDEYLEKLHNVYIPDQNISKGLSLTRLYKRSPSPNLRHTCGREAPMSGFGKHIKECENSFYLNQSHKKMNQKIRYTQQAAFYSNKNNNQSQLSIAKDAAQSN